MELTLSLEGKARRKALLKARRLLQDPGVGRRTRPYRAPGPSDRPP